MQYDLSERERKALQKLREECDYEDERNGDTDSYILGNKLKPGTGDKTLLELENRDLISKGLNRWSKKVGYRITDLGRESLETRKPSKKHTPRRKLKPLPAALRELKGLLDE